eukprot:TRINITY_DN2082_c0_g2_i1.p1 TRINITY_DN2082_c0_g2~~TRINITY_DN2082_c0_g2_i1.p1  ORF type:complete len:548 (+),score=142.84 TRINITY_DN2082_c0_g2_i1:329-1972(+)
MNPQAITSLLLMGTKSSKTKSAERKSSADEGISSDPHTRSDSLHSSSSLVSCTQTPSDLNVADENPSLQSQRSPTLSAAAPHRFVRRKQLTKDRSVRVLSLLRSSRDMSEKPSSTTDSVVFLFELSSSSPTFDEAIDKIFEVSEAIDQHIASKFQQSLSVITTTEEYILNGWKRRSGALTKFHSQAESFALNIKQHLNIYTTKANQNASQGQTIRLPISIVHGGRAFIDSVSVSLPTARFQGKITFAVPVSCEAFVFQTKRLMTGSHSMYISRDLATIKEPVARMGSRGGETGMFREPFGIAIHPKTGNYFVMNKDNQRIDEISPDLEIIRSFTGSTNGQSFSYARGVAINQDGSVLAIADTLNHRVQIWDMDGKCTHLIIEAAPKQRLESTQFVAFDVDDNLYVSDKSKKVIHKYNSKWEYVCSIGGEGDGNPIGEVGGIMINDYNELMAIACRSSEVKVYSTDGHYLRSITVQQTGSVENAYSNCLGRGPDGGFIVSDTSNNVHFYSDDGVLLHQITVKIPIGTAFDHLNRLVVVSYGDHSLYIY